MGNVETAEKGIIKNKDGSRVMVSRTQQRTKPKTHDVKGRVEVATSAPSRDTGKKPSTIIARK